ncbi:MAG: phytoene desaturase family protein, partial [Chloroflexota bacterium]
DLRPIEPLTRYFYQDGTVLNISQTLPETLAQIEAIGGPGDVEGYLSYLAYASRIHRITGPVFIYDQPPTPASFLRVPVWEMPRVDPFRTMHGAIKSFVKSPYLRQLLGRFATYVGASPYLAPATLNVIAHVELNGGVWYPAGGIYTIAAAYEKLCTELGVDIQLNVPVEQIVTSRSGQVQGVQVGGETILSPTVVANIDVATVHDKLLPQSAQVVKKSERLQAAEPSCSGFVLLLGENVERPLAGVAVGAPRAAPLTGLAHHNIFFSQDYEKEFQQIFGDGVMPDDPTIYVAITSKTDPDHSPDGHENWFVLVNAPALDASKWDWEQKSAEYRDLVFQKLKVHGVDLDGRIVTEKIMTPIDIQNMTGAFRGALYGTSSNDKWAAFRRPHNKSKEIEGLYFCGGTSHPGGGVPMVTLSGKVAAEMILENS